MKTVTKNTNTKKTFSFFFTALSLSLLFVVPAIGVAENGTWYLKLTTNSSGAIRSTGFNSLSACQQALSSVKVKGDGSCAEQWAFVTGGSKSALFDSQAKCADRAVDGTPCTAQGVWEYVFTPSSGVIMNSGPYSSEQACDDAITSAEKQGISGEALCYQGTSAPLNNEARIGNEQPSVQGDSGNSSPATILSPNTASAQSTGNTGTYTLLAPLPIGAGGSDTNTVTLGGEKAFQDYLNSAFKIGITIAILLAVIMIVIGGIQWMGESVFGKESGKKKIQDALTGLVLALAIFLILNTINPDLVNLRLSVAKLALPPALPAGTGIVPDTSSPLDSQCPGCAIIPSSLDVKTGACTVAGLPSNTCRLNAGLENALLQVKNNQSVSSMNWQITEAWPQTIGHKSDCHSNGRCVDVNFYGSFLTGANRTPENINAFCGAAKSAGLKPYYEVGTAAELSTLTNAGVTCARTATVTAPHFHIEM